MKLLAPHFSLEALIFSQTAKNAGIPNVPGNQELFNLTQLAQVLEKLRTKLALPIRIHCAFRAPMVNKLVGGVPGSAHEFGYAADFSCLMYGNSTQVCRAFLELGIPFDQLIDEGTWVHLSIAPAMRHEVLTANFAKGEKTTYSKGLTHG